MRRPAEAILLSAILLGQSGCEQLNNTQGPHQNEKRSSPEASIYDAVSEGLNSYIKDLQENCVGLNIENHSSAIYYHPTTRQPKITLTIFYKHADTLNSQDFTFSEPVDMNGQSAGQIVSLITISLEAKIMRFFQSRGISCDQRIQRASNSTPTRGYPHI